MKSDAIQKLCRAARLSAEAAKLYAEAADELSAAGPPNQTPSLASPITEVDRARARRALKKAGAKIYE